MADAVASGQQPVAVEVEALRELVEARLRSVWREVPDGLQGLVEALDYSLLAPGKRVRPVLALAAAACCGVEPRAAVDVAVAFELVHAYSLVHDDLPCMDDDELRRGMPTSHVRFGEGVAVLVGDALQAQAHALIAGAPGEARDLLEVVGVLARASGWAGMVGGQYLDVQPAGAGGRELAALRDLHDRKTGALIAGALEAGAVLGGAGVEVRERFAAFGRELGWLFQLVDDLLDEVGDSEVTGKASGSDARHGKVTAIGVFGGVDGLRAAADAQLATCLELAALLPAEGGGVLPDLARYVRSRDH